MQRLTRFLRDERERGATAVIVGVCLLVLVGFGALAVDAGALWWDRQQLRNGADAGALAIAQACATDSTSVECTSGGNATADAFARGNKLDASASGTVVSLQTTGPDRHVTVETTTTRQAWLANVFGIAGADVGARATATWAGSPEALTTIPLAFSYCQFYWQNGFYEGMPTPGTPVTIWLKSKAKDFPGDPGRFPCMKGGAHNEAGGGFGWVKQTPGLACAVASSRGAWLGSDPGNNVKCSAAELRERLGTAPGDVVLIPIFDAAQGNGNNGKFRVDGYAALRVSAYCFHPTAKMNASCNGNTQHLSGTFVGFGTLDDSQGGGGTNYGVVTVKLAQ